MADRRDSKAVIIQDPTSNSLQAGVNAGGNLKVISAANSGVDIGDVDILSVIPGTGATQLGKPEDGIHAIGATGVMILGIRDDTLGINSNADGDYEAFHINASGRLYVTATVDAALPAGDNNIGNVDIVTVPADPFGLNADAASATGSISAKLRFIAATGIPITGDALTALQLIDNVVHVDDAAFTLGTSSGVMVMGFAGTQSVNANDACALACETDGSIHIHDGGNTITIDGSLTTVSTVTTCSTVTTLTGGGIAHDSADSGNPVKVGAIATASLLGRTPVAGADRSDLVAATDGALLIRDGSLEDIISERVTNTNGTSTDMTGAFAATASQRIYLTDITICNSSATFCTVDIRDGAAGAVLWTFPVPATGGVTHKYTRPLRFTANTALAYDVSAAITTVTISVAGFKSKA